MWLELLQRENTLIDTLPVISFAIDRLILALERLACTHVFSCFSTLPFLKCIRGPRPISSITCFSYLSWASAYFVSLSIGMCKGVDPPCS